MVRMIEHMVLDTFAVEEASSSLDWVVAGTLEEVASSLVEVASSLVEVALDNRQEHRTVDKDS